MSSTPLPERSGRPRARGVGRLGLALLGALTLVIAGATAGVGCADEEPPRTVEIVVPAGTQDRLDAGEEVVVMPARLELKVGDELVIRNHDDVQQSVGPHVVDAGAVLRFEYGAAGVYEGYCPLSAGERYEIVVTER